MASGRGAFRVSGRRSSILPAKRLRLLVGVTILLALPLLYLSFTTLMAGITGRQAQMFLDDWGGKGADPSEKAWLFAVDAAERSLQWTPGSGASHADRLGRIYEWYGVSQPFGDPEVEPTRRKAVEAYRRSVQARPLWPYTRVQLAYAKLRLLEFDDEFYQQLAQARRLAPWRVRVHAPLAEIGMIAWRQLNAQQKAETWQSLELVVRYDPRRAKPLQNLAERAGLTASLCESLDSELLKQRGSADVPVDYSCRPSASRGGGVRSARGCNATADPECGRPEQDAAR